MLEERQKEKMDHLLVGRCTSGLGNENIFLSSFFFFFETSFLNKILITSIQNQSESLFWDCIGVDFTFHCHSLVNKVFL